MKKSFLVFSLLSSIALSAQTTIIDEKFEKENIPVEYRYFKENDELFLFKGRAFGLASITSNIYSFDSNKNKTAVIENSSLAKVVFSKTRNTIKFYDVSSPYKPKLKYYLNGKTTDIIPESDFDYVYKFCFGLFTNFNNQYEYGFTNQNGKSNVNLDDDLYLESCNIQTREKKRVKIEKPDVSKLTDPSSKQPLDKLGFKCNLTDVDFKMMTELISKDFKTMVLNKTTYGLDGKKYNDTAFHLNLPDNTFTYSVNGANFSDFPNTGKTSHYISLIDTYEESTTGNVYVYGLFSDKPSKVKERVKPLGFYIFKFDKNGRKIWESISKIDDKENLNKIYDPSVIKISLSDLNENLCFSVSVDDNSEFLNYAILDKQLGKVLKSNKMVYKGDLNKNPYGKFIYSPYESKAFKNKRFNIDGFIAMDSNSKISEYVNNLNSKKELQFNAVFSKKGIWLIETDNKDYYKVTLF